MILANCFIIVPCVCTYGLCEGTNDNHRLLPLQVYQTLSADASLRATNGKMLQIILDNRQYITLNIVGSAQSGPFAILAIVQR